MVAGRSQRLALAAALLLAALEPAHAQNAKQGFRYHYPIDTLVPVMMVQGPDGAFSHAGVHAFDFALAEGTPVLAARRGVVKSVRDGFTECCVPPEQAEKVNQVVIAHPDGSEALYSHLRRGEPLEDV